MWWTYREQIFFSQLGAKLHQKQSQLKRRSLCNKTFMCSQNTFQHLPTANKLNKHIVTERKQIFDNHLASLHVPFNFTNSCYINSARPILINQRILWQFLPYQHSFDSSEPKISFLWLNSCTIANTKPWSLYTWWHDSEGLHGMFQSSSYSPITSTMHTPSDLTVEGHAYSPRKEHLWWVAQIIRNVTYRIKRMQI